MTPRRRGSGAAGVLSAFVVGVLGVSASVSYHPVRILAGESSVGTWMSGFLLAVSAALAVALGTMRGSRIWTVSAGFFALAALDERFQFHEHLKARILFASPDLPSWVAEAPILVGALAGLLVAFLLDRHLCIAGRILLLAAVLLGSASAAIDVAHAGVVWEEILKLLAELALGCALLGEFDSTLARSSPGVARTSVGDIATSTSASELSVQHSSGNSAQHLATGCRTSSESVGSPTLISRPMGWRQAGIPQKEPGGPR